MTLEYQGIKALLASGWIQTTNKRWDKMNMFFKKKRKDGKWMIKFIFPHGKVLNKIMDREDALKYAKDAEYVNIKLENI